MPVRIVQLRSRNPVVVALVLVVVLALLAAVFAVGVTLLTAAAVVGGAGLLARRARRGRVLPPAQHGAPPRADRALDRTREVFPPGHQAPDARRLPPGTDG